MSPSAACAWTAPRSASSRRQRTAAASGGALRLFTVSNKALRAMAKSEAATVNSHHALDRDGREAHPDDVVASGPRATHGCYTSELQFFFAGGSPNKN